MSLNDNLKTGVRKRGRPRKSLNLEKVNKVDKKKTIPIAEVQREIILHIPGLGLENVNMAQKGISSESEKNTFSMKDSKDFKDNKNQKLDSTDNILIISEDSKGSDDSNSNDSKDHDVDELLNTIQQKNILIKKLQTQIANMKSSNEIYTATKETNKYTAINIKLFDYKNNKLIVYDKTHLPCWWDGYSFDNLPFYLPDMFHNDVWHVMGCFCSPQCAAAYNLNLNDYKTPIRYSLIKKLQAILTGVEQDISPAHPREMLLSGTISLMDFRKSCTLNNKECRMLMPPLNAITLIVEERSKDNNIKYESNMSASLETNNIKKINNTNKKNLFDTMGIIEK